MPPIVVFLYALAIVGAIFSAPQWAVAVILFGAFAIHALDNGFLEQDE